MNSTTIVLLIALVVIVITSVTSFEFNCDSISTPKCFCESKAGGGSHGVELLCPNSLLAEVHNVTLTLNSGQYDPSHQSAIDGTTDASTASTNFNLIQVVVKCNPYEPGKEMQWQLLQGLDLEGASEKYWYTLKLTLCPILTPEGLDQFLSAISLPKARLVGFSFEPPQDKSNDPPIPITNSSLLFSFISGFQSLESLDLRRCNLIRLPDGAFSSLGHLKELHLKENQLASLASTDFQNLSRLKLLDLSFNSIKSLDKIQFPSSLELLDLNSNKLEEVGKEAFSGLARLRILSLRQNTQLKSIHYNAFDGLGNLTTLDLVYTAFRALPRLDNLQHLHNLYISYLDNNPQIFLAHAQTNTTLYGDLAANDSVLSTVFTTQDPETAFAGLSPLLQTLQLVSDGFVRVANFGTGAPFKNLTVLNLSVNQIMAVPTDAFNRFPALTQLDLSLNQIAAFEGFGVPLASLKVLNMGNNFLQRLDRKVFRGLGRLETLRMGNNRISSIDTRAFEHLTSLLDLDLSNNQLGYLSDQHPSPEFSLVEGDEANLPQGHAEAAFLLDSGFEQSYFRFCTRLQTINLAHNQIPLIYDDWKNLFLRIHSVDLSHNALTALHVNDINFLTISKTLTLDLRNNNVSTVDMDHAAFFLEESAEKRNMVVKLDGNPLECDCRSIAFHRFSLKGIHFETNDLKCAAPPDLAGTLFKMVKPEQLICPFHPPPDQGAGECPSMCECWRIPYNHTIAIDCSFRRLHNFIPSVLSLRIPKGYKIVLNLAGNGYTSLNTSHAQNISSNVVQIDLTRNQLDSLGFLKVLIPADEGDSTSEAPSTSTTRTPQIGVLTDFNSPPPPVSVSLAHNEFQCSDCEFHKLVKVYFKQISDYNELTCIADGSNKGSSRLNGSSVVRHILSSDQQALETEYCSYLYDNTLSSSVLALAVLAGILFALTGLLVAVWIRHGWALRAFLYSKGLGACFFIHDEEEEGYEKMYDAFVSYSHKDEPWVISQLVSRLEEEEGFKLCLHYRDWTPGDWIPDQIVQSVDKSRRTVIILSKNFVESIWSRLEFKAAHSQALNERTNRLILILVGDDLQETDIYDEDLRMYMKMNTYLKWSDPWLWHKLKFALPHKKKAPAVAGLAHVQHERAIQLDKLRSKMELQEVEVKANGIANGHGPKLQVQEQVEVT